VKPILVSHADAFGGAARAAYRLHRALRGSSIDSQLWVAVKKSDDPSVVGPPGELGNGLAVVRALVGRRLMRLQRSSNPILHSPAILPSGRVNALNAAVADVVNLHWINEEFLSIADVASIRKPIVWTLHDMWAFSGAEHYGSEDPTARWRAPYDSTNRPATHRGLDLDRWTWERKARHWRRPLSLVVPSSWLADCVRGSHLMRDWPVRVIPNALDLAKYHPIDKGAARSILGLPRDNPLVLFGAIGGGTDPRKGWDLLHPALARLASAMPGVHGAIFGQGEPASPPSLGLPLHWLGALTDDATLALAYSAADVVVVPSRQEAFGQAASEAQACGRPVVAFRSTGLTDVVVHQRTGYLADPFDSEDLAVGLRWTLQDPERLRSLGANARRHAEATWAADIVAGQYIAAYEEAVASAGQWDSSRSLSAPRSNNVNSLHERPSQARETGW
jgi:glycosyltransferase involved in cell wall biosynthesis